MALLKIENADHLSSHPFVFDVMDAKDKMTATHVLKFGEFVLVPSIDNLRVVSPFAYAARVADEAKRTAAKEAADQADNVRAQKKHADSLAAQRAVEEQRSVKAARAFAHAAQFKAARAFADAAQRPKTKAKTSAVAKHK